MMTWLCYNVYILSKPFPSTKIHFAILYQDGAVSYIKRLERTVMSLKLGYIELSRTLTMQIPIVFQFKDNTLKHHSSSSLS